MQGMGADRRANERAYQELKGAIVAGDLKVRQRLDIDTLARRLKLSATPVRQALAILASERLVKVNASRGYYVAFWSDRELKDLYAWRCQLALMALESFDAAAIMPAASGRRPHRETYEALMERLQVNANPELRRAARAADERLHAALRAEAGALANADEETSALLGAVRAADKALLKRLVRRYFRRRVANSNVIRAHAHADATPQNGD